MSLQLVQLACPGCSGTLRYTAGSPIASCPFCGSTIALVSGQGRPVAADGHEYHMIPFRITAQEFKRQLLLFLADGDYTPDDVFDAVRIRKETGLYTALYLFEGTARVSWSASAGFERTESYVDTVSETRNGRTERRPVTRTRTVTDWRPVTGDLLHDYRLGVLASQGVPDAVATLVESDEGLPPTDAFPAVDPTLVQGYALEPFDGTPDEKFRERGNSRLEVLLRAQVDKRIPGDSHKQVSFTHSRDHERCTRLYRPLWLAVYQYGDKRFAFALEGATGRSLGTRPEDASLKTAVEKHKKNLSTANILALVVGILSFFVLPIFGAIVVGVAWYFYVEAEKKQLRILQERIDASRKKRAEALAAAQAGVGPTDVAPSGEGV